MDAFENLVAMLLQHQGYWVRPSFKVNLTKEEKRRIGIPSCPRWELDIVAYNGSKNEVLVVECKSYLDSRGVSFNAFDGSNREFAKRFKLFNDEVLREVVFNRLVTQLGETRSCRPSPKVTLCLAAGRVATELDRQRLIEFFRKEKWEFFDDEWIRDRLVEVAKGGYENEVSAIVAKIILRKKETA